MGAAHYCQKPFEPDELIELVEKHIGRTAHHPLEGIWRRPKHTS